jgi:hypothetical protein
MEEQNYANYLHQTAAFHQSLFEIIFQEKGLEFLRIDLKEDFGLF